MSLDYHHPPSLPALLSAVAADPGPKWFLAGGTDINVQIRGGGITDGAIYGISHLPELRGIEVRGGWWRIGATTSVATVVSHRDLRADIPYLGESLEDFAAPALRSMATIGGNIANGSPTADTLPPLLVLDAEVELASQQRTRRLPAADFFTGYKRNRLEQDEIITAVLIPRGAQQGFETYYRKVGSRRTLTIAKVAVAGLRRLGGGLIREARVAVGSVNEYPRRLRSLEALLQNADPRDLNLGDIDRAIRSGITPISDFRSDAEYREKVCLNLIHEFVGR